MSCKLRGMLTGLMFAAVMTGVLPAAEARIIVEPNFVGTLLITFPDGKVQMYDSGEALPDIPTGSSIEVFGGKVTVSTDQDDSLKLSCLGSEAAVGGGATATMGCAESDGKLSVIKGSATVDQPDGSQKTVSEGRDYEIKSTDGTEDSAPPTAEGDPLGASVPEVNPPDSRSLEASVSQ